MNIQETAVKKSILRKITRYLIPGALFLALGLWFGVPRVTGRSALSPEAGVETGARAAVQDGEEAGTETVADDGEETGAEIVAETVVEDSAESAAEDITVDGSETGIATGTTTGTATHDDPAPPDCCVHVCGAVKNPGVYTLPAASRAADFVQAAGGFSEEAARDAVNLAAQPADGTQLYIPTEAEAADILREHALRSMTGGQPVGQAADAGRSPGAGAGAAGTGAGGVGAGAAGGADSGGGGAQRVNLNQADSLQLQTLPGIGEKTAEKILQYREQHGGFRSTEELKNVSGIKEKSFERIRDLVTTGP